MISNHHACVNFNFLNFMHLNFFTHFTLLKMRRGEVKFKLKFETFINFLSKRFLSSLRHKNYLLKHQEELKNRVNYLINERRIFEEKTEKVQKEISEESSHWLMLEFNRIIKKSINVSRDG